MSSIIEDYAAPGEPTEEPQPIEQPIEDRPYYKESTYYVARYERTTICGGEFHRDGGFVNDMGWMSSGSFDPNYATHFESAEKAQQQALREGSCYGGSVMHLDTLKIYRVVERTKATLEPVPLP